MLGRLGFPFGRHGVQLNRLEPAGCACKTDSAGELNQCCAFAFLFARGDCTRSLTSTPFLMLWLSDLSQFKQMHRGIGSIPLARLLCPVYTGVHLASKRMLPDLMNKVQKGG